MKFNMKTMILAAVMLSLTAFPVIDATAKGDYKSKGKWEEKMDKFHDELGLSPEQKAQLKANREKHRGQMEGVINQIKAKKDQMQVELQKADYDESKVRALHNDIKGLKSQMEDARLNSILEVRKVLTPEQYNKFKTMKENWKGKKQKKWKEAKDDNHVEETSTP